jgi:hypothetical protein
VIATSSNGATTWASREGYEVSVGLVGDKKEYLSVMTTMRANGKKEPLDSIAHSKTARVEASQTGPVRPYQRDHSAEGWMTRETFAQ